MGSIDFDGDGSFEVESFAFRIKSPGRTENEELFKVYIGLNPLQRVVFLRESQQTVSFRSGTLVSTYSSRFSPPGEDDRIATGRFYQTRFPGTTWTYIDPFLSAPPTFWSTETNLLIGCKFVADDGTHFGWINLARPDRNFLTQYDVAGYDWNPVPGEPIEAGMPPAIPLGSAVTPEGFRIHWPAVVGLSKWILESADSLKPDAPWAPIPATTNGEALLDPPKGMRFFRLRRP